MAVRIVESDSLAACDAQQWDQLVARSSEATVFQSRAWVNAWWETFRQPDWRVRLWAIYEATELVALAPLYERRDERARRTLRMLGEEHADYTGLICRDGAARVVEAALRNVADAIERPATICFDEVPEGSSTQRALAALCRAQPLQWVRTGRTPCPWVPIRGNEQAVQALLRKTSLRRHRSSLERLGKLAVRHELEAAAIEPHLPLFFEQHVSRWAGTAYPSLFEKQSNRDFYRRLVAELCPSGRLLFSILSLDGQPAAFHFGFLSNAKLLWYKPTFDVRLARHSPGEVLLGGLIEHALEQRFDALDFTRGAEPFKSRFASRVSYNSSYVRLDSQLAAAVRQGRAAARTVLNWVRALRPA